jgi:DNA-binding beta-propeller fold protein YncE
VKIGKVLAASAALATALAVLTPRAAMANGVGDLYVASPSGVLETHVASSSVISTIPLSPSPQSLVFSPDGRTLYAGTAGTAVTPIDILTLNIQATITMPGPVSSLAFPAGQVLVAAMPQRRTLGFVTVHGGAVTESAQLPGPGNILAGDRREARVAIAEAGSNWLEVVDPGTETMRKATVPGEIVAMAIDRDKGAVLVATRNPEALLLVDLTSLATTWTVALPATPVAVVAMASTVVVGSGTTLLKVDGQSATSFATTKQAVEVLTASDEGSVVHVAEASGIEVFDSAGVLKRTLDLSGGQAPVAMAGVPRGSSLYLGQGADASPSASPGEAAVATSAPLVTPKPPTTSTVVDAATQIAGSAPFQSAVAVALAILFLCWLFIRWYDGRALRSR